VRDRVEIIAPVDFEHPPELLLHAGVAQTLQRLMCLASGSEAERAVQEVLLVNPLPAPSRSPVAPPCLRRLGCRAASACLPLGMNALRTDGA
jgi:hypothetical protein